MKHEFSTLQWDLDKAGMLYSGHDSVACTFSWNHETNGLNYAVKIIQKTKLQRAAYGRHFFMIKIESFVLEKPLYSGGYKETCSATIAGLQMKRC